MPVSTASIFLPTTAYRATGRCIVALLKLDDLSAASGKTASYGYDSYCFTRIQLNGRNPKEAQP
jgi:hypothetical protein